MKLLSLKLAGRYKGLIDQSFNFHHTQGSIVALIGLNGSGKSQLLELIAEIFAFLERCQREDFKVKTSLGFGFELVYQLSGTADHSAGSPAMVAGEPTAVLGGILNPKYKVVLANFAQQPSVYIWREDNWFEIDIKSLELPFVVGYASGLNENLQRSFMKNAVQFYEVQRIRLKRRKELAAEKLKPSEMMAIDKYYIDKYPHIFKSSEIKKSSNSDTFDSGSFDSDPFDSDFYDRNILESDTFASGLIYLDYDSAYLMLACLAILEQSELDILFSEVSYKYPRRVVFKYDFRAGVAEEDAIRDIKMLLRIAGQEQFEPIGKKTTDKQYDVFELDYLAGTITFDLTNASVVRNLRGSNYGDPIALFIRLYKLQQLGIKNWQGTARTALKKDNFFGAVKKPLKTKLPLMVVALDLADENGRVVSLDDLSDGEAQLLEVLATTRIFSPQRTLFLFDEPETHLNPSWRTHFHKHLSKAMIPNEDGAAQSQVFLSSHSPFMVSSLKREDVLFFERDTNGAINMCPVDCQTYGASFDVLIKEFFGLRSLISQTVVEKVKEQLPENDDAESLAAARQWVEQNLGDSMEKAYLLRKLQK